MKNSKILFLLSFSLILSCSRDTPITEEKTSPDNVINHRYSIERNLSYSDSKLVIRYADHVNEYEKPAIRQSHQVTKYELCDCSDEKIELWEFNVSDIKSKLGELEADPDLEDVEHQYYMEHSQPNYSTTASNYASLISKTVSTNTGVTVAVLDTGVDYNYENFNRPFLYNSQEASNECDRELPNISGWDFVNEDNDPFDDNGHGTIVTYIIYEHLLSNRLRFQILPVKIFNKKGETDYFTILCGFIYAAQNNDVDVINMSFGWYYHELSILSTYIGEHPDKLISTSAGNAGVDTDEDAHYPSSYTDQHLMATTAVNNGYSDLAPFANFGTTSIDIAAPGHILPFYAYGSTYYVSGTSYASAFTSAKAAELHSEGMNPINLKNDVVNSGMQLNTLNSILNPVVIID